jgi:membrane associated rhomboid family serine protease
MSDQSNGKNDKNQDDKGNIIHFSELEKRQKALKKESEKEQKERERLEEEYRRKYRAHQGLRANQQANIARQSASGKTPFINWVKIPPFTRAAVITFLAIHLIVTFALDDAQRIVLFMNFGFVPAYYSGAIPWVWSALLAPFTTALLHGGWMHLITNCVMMMAMGVFFERQFGSRITLIFFIFCMMSGNLMYFALNPIATNPVVGASGAISGLFGAVILMMSASGMTGFKAKKRGPLPIIILWIAIMIGVGLVSSDTAWQSHLGGFLGGLGLFQLWSKGKLKF